MAHVGHLTSWNCSKSMYALLCSSSSVSGLHRRTHGANLGEGGGHALRSQVQEHGATHRGGGHALAIEQHFVNRVRVTSLRGSTRGTVLVLRTRGGRTCGTTAATHLGRIRRNAIDAFHKADYLHLRVRTKPTSCVKVARGVVTTVRETVNVART